MCVKPTLFGLLCAWREVLILRQHLLIHIVLKVSLRSLQLVNSCLKICRQPNAVSDYSKVLQKVLKGFGGTFILLALRLVLLDQIVPLRLHILYLVMVLGEGAVKLGLEQSRMHF
jgi:hypothetical protein